MSRQKRKRQTLLSVRLSPPSTSTGLYMIKKPPFTDWYLSQAFTSFIFKEFQYHRNHKNIDNYDEDITILLTDNWSIDSNSTTLIANTFNNYMRDRMMKHTIEVKYFKNRFITEFSIPLKPGDSTINFSLPQDLCCDETTRPFHTIYHRYKNIRISKGISQ